MKPVIVINRLAIKPGTIDEFIEARHIYASSLTEKPKGLIGSRLYRGLDGPHGGAGQRVRINQGPGGDLSVARIQRESEQPTRFCGRPVQPFMKSRTRRTASISAAMQALRFGESPRRIQENRDADHAD